MSKVGVHGLACSGTWGAAECERATAALNMDIAVEARRYMGEAQSATPPDAAS